jgi:hypothetical protein
MVMKVILGGAGLMAGGWGLGILNVAVFVGSPYHGYGGWTHQGPAGGFNLDSGWFEIPDNLKFLTLNGRSAWFTFEDSDRQSRIKLTLTLKNSDGTEDVSVICELAGCDLHDFTSGAAFSFRTQLYQLPQPHCPVTGVGPSGEWAGQGWPG